MVGGTGLLGSVVHAQLMNRCDVISVSRHSTGGKHLEVDLTEDWNPRKLPAKLDEVVFLAQSRHYREFPRHTRDIFGVNVAGLQRLLDYALGAGVRRFVLASSGGVYGFGEQAFAEGMEVRQRGDLGFYLGTKICAEILAENYSSFFKVIVLRFFFIYGPGQRADMLMPRLVDSVREGRPVQLQGADGIRINPIYVEDAAAAVVAALDLEESQRINVAGEEVLSMRQIGEVIGDQVGREPCFEVDADTEPRHLVGDISKMKELLVSPRVSFDDGIGRMVDADTA